MEVVVVVVVGRPDDVGGAYLIVNCPKWKFPAGVDRR